MSDYRCEICNTIHHEGEEVYWVRQAFDRGIEPVCCMECVEAMKQKEINKLQERIDMIKKHKVRKEMW